MNYLKKHLSIFTIILMVIGLSSCSSESDEPTPQPDVTPASLSSISFTIGGEMETSEEETPLSRAGEPEKLYCIRIDRMKTDGSQGFYIPYEYGVFDNLDAVKAVVMTGYKYRFIVASYQNAEDRLFVRTDGTYGSYPFANSAVTNAFTHPETSVYPTLSSSVATIFDPNSDEEEGWSTVNPRLKVFYGCVTDFEPDGTDQVLNVEMLRIGYGFSVKIAKLNEGTINVTAKNFFKGVESAGIQFSRDFTANLTQGQSAGVTVADGLTSPENANWAETTREFTKSVTLTFTWTHSNGEIETFNKSITCKRNVLLTVNADFSGGASNSTFILREETPDLGSESTYLEF